jgi:hypothetical protein
MVRSGRAVCLVSMFAWNATAALLIFLDHASLQGTER